MLNNVLVKSANETSHYNDIAIYSNFLLNYLNKTFLTDFLNIIIYPIDLNAISTSSYSYLLQFVNSLRQDLNEQINIDIPKTHYLSLLNVYKEILKLKDDQQFNFINYENITSYLKIDNRFVENIFNNVSENPIEDNITFNKNYSKLIQDVQIYNQMQIIKSTIFKWNNFLTISNNDNSNLSALNWVKNFRDAILEANNGLSEISALDKSTKATDFMMFHDEASIRENLFSIVNFLKTSYRSYNTGYDLFDNNISGIESSSVMVIAGPSNHAKSIFMLNIARSVMENNETNDDNDLYIMITLEDDINKLFRRIISIFGNYEATLVKNMFIQFSEILQSNNTDKITEEKITSLLENITKDSIISITGGKKHFIIKHSSENTFSMEDAQKFMDGFEMQGLKVRGLFVD
jgi:hypothetical protein